MAASETDDLAKGACQVGVPPVDQASDILDDARRVAAFGIRSGKLTDDRLLKAIAAVEQLRAAAGGSANGVELLAPLAAEMPRAQAAIEPMTLKELRDRNPFAADLDEAADRKSRRIKAGLATVASILLITISCLLVWQSRTAAVVAEFREDRPRQFESLMVDLVVMTERFAGPRDSAPITPLELSAVGAKMMEARELLRRIYANALLAERQDATFYTLGLFRFSAPAAVAAEVTDYSVTDKTGTQFSAGPESADVPAGSAAAATAAAAPRPAAAIFPGCDDQGVDIKEWNALLVSEPPRDIASARGFAATVTLYYRVRRIIECVSGIEAQRITLPPEVRSWVAGDKDGDLSAKLMVTNSILLPALMGILGALIYHFRVYMDPLRPDVPLQRIVLRVFLGGFAGMTTFFLVSTDGRIAAGAQPTGLAGLAIPFILGFSIDVFFRMLDKLVQQMSQWVDGIGARKETAAETRPSGAAG